MMQTCFDKSRIVNVERHEAFIQQSICPFCNKVAGEIGQCQLGCGQLFGFSCFQNSKLDQCPKCQKVLDKPKHEYKNRFLNNMVSSQIKIKCKNFVNGCPQILPMSCSEIQKHEEQCDYYPVQCENESKGCQWISGNAILKEHLQNCDYSEFQCEFCHNQQENKTVFYKKQQQQHQQQCENQKVQQLINQLKQEEDYNKYKTQIIEILESQQKKLKKSNQTIQQIKNYAVMLEKNEQNKRDKKILLNDISNGILNFNSLEQLQKQLAELNTDLIKGVKLNDTNLKCYEYSYQSKFDFTDTIQKIQQFANNGEKNSIYSLARLYYWGDKNIPKDIQKTQELAQKAINLQSPEAFWLMGDFYYENKGSKTQDLKKALQYYHQAQKFGNAESANSLGQIYDDGEFGKANEKKALEYFQFSAKKGDYGGLYNLAVYYQEGYGGLKKDLEKAYKYYLQSAKKGDIDAMKQVSEMLKQGKGVQKSNQKSAKWAKRAGYYKNKFNNEIPSYSNLATCNSLNSIYCSSD